jgi:hypothetical protein
VRRNGNGVHASRVLGIVHDIPGRLRLRLPPGAGSAELTDVIDQLPGAQGTLWSPRTRSLLIHYDPDVLNAADITRAVAEHADLTMPDDDAPADQAADGRSPVAAALSDTFSNVNARIAQRTRGRVDLPMLLSIGLLFWAGRQLLRGPVTALSWTSAIWYAHGLFRDYHGPPRG